VPCHAGFVVVRGESRPEALLQVLKKGGCRSTSRLQTCRASDIPSPQDLAVRSTICALISAYFFVSSTSRQLAGRGSAAVSGTHRDTVIRVRGQPSVASSLIRLEQRLVRNIFGVNEAFV